MMIIYGTHWLDLNHQQPTDLLRRMMKFGDGKLTPTQTPLTAETNHLTPTHFKYLYYR